MADTVKVQFTAKPGLYPPHKGGQTWLHEKATVRRTPHEGAPDGYTTKIIPTKVLQTGDVIEVDASLAKTLTSRYECFSLVGSTSAAPAKKTSVKSDA
jgi:hypothetical protein